MAKVKSAIPPLKMISPEKIATIVQDLIKGKRPLEVTIDVHAKEFYSSRIIKTGRIKGRPSLIIDTVMPAEQGKRALARSEELEVGFLLRDDPHTFHSSFFSMEEEGEFSAVAIAYPEAIYFHQFRNAERFVFTPDDPPAFAKVEFPITKQTMGHEVGLVRDLSIDGLSFSTRNNKLEPETRINVEIEITEMEFLEAKATVVEISNARDEGFPYKCGISFDYMEQMDRERISRFIHEERRNRAKLDKNAYDMERIMTMAKNKIRIKARLEGREVQHHELEEIQDFLEFKNIELDESLDL